MKNHLLKGMLWICGFFLLQSCNVSTTNHYFADKKISFESDVDMAEAMEMMNSFMPDSVKQKDDFMNPEKFPRNWKSMYDLDKEEGKIHTNPDSIKLTKKIFFKGNFDSEKFKGFSVKSDPLTKEELQGTGQMMGKKSSFMNNSAFDNWSGKILQIDMSKLNMSPEDMLGNGDKTDDPSQKKEMDGFLNMMDMNFKNKLVFDKKIKSIKGKHDWIKKIDDYSVELNFNIKEMMDKDHKYTNKDNIIIIETE